MLKDIPIDFMKVELHFIHGRIDDKKGTTIISSVVRLAGDLGLPVIAGGS